MREARSRLHGDYTGQSAKVFDNGMDRIEAAVGQLEIKRAAIQEAMTSFGRVTSQTEDANISLAGTVGISGGASWT
ncbi:hypothetical protein [Micromonospora qiuiae]|nr:hypothetical protein [Micromonospora qiuiae]